MRPKTLLTGLLVLGLLFVAVGDRILPQPLNDASRNVRTSINQMMLGLFPKSRTVEKLEKREKEVENLLEQKARPKSN
ncbi:MAG: hypothetical protein IGR93_22060 [Hydrococcus sp. C42_A2020_068]|uniref:hypothetical protein n=1 Tax=Pleurocapsa sp. PCC 7327 TaxID=118163 RepID=UPI00029FCB5F|nr:hypothetical protein [Pleurocapsa sp. PCC 7327]AFY77257.1 hypothetical protein Ple7327_1912 [Pleurocapsa sp. PCC 7327]MBF2022699.1 hypothetical protein [Hydrococcus sp. C42_A2020_068]